VGLRAGARSRVAARVPAARGARPHVGVVRQPRAARRRRRPAVRAGVARRAPVGTRSRGLRDGARARVLREGHQRLPRGLPPGRAAVGARVRGPAPLPGGLGAGRRLPHDPRPGVRARLRRAGAGRGRGDRARRARGGQGARPVRERAAVPHDPRLGGRAHLRPQGRRGSVAARDVAPT